VEELIKSGFDSVEMATQEYCVDVASFAVVTDVCDDEGLNVKINKIGMATIHLGTDPVYGGGLRRDPSTNPAQPVIVGTTYQVDVSGTFSGEYAESTTFTLVFKKKSDADKFVREAKRIIQTAMDSTAAKANKPPASPVSSTDAD